MLVVRAFVFLAVFIGGGRVVGQTSLSSLPKDLEARLLSASPMEYTSARDELLKQGQTAAMADLEQSAKAWAETLKSDEGAFDLTISPNESTKPSEFAVLRFIPQLHYLTVDGAPLPDDVLLFLSGSGSLNEVQLVNLTESLRTYEDVDLPALKALRIIDSSISTEALCNLSIKSLKELSLENTPLASNFLAKFPADSLEVLVLIDTGLQGRDFSKISRFQQLKKVAISLDAYSDSLAAGLRQIKGLEQLTIICLKSEVERVTEIKHDFQGQIRVDHEIRFELK